MSYHKQKLNDYERSYFQKFFGTNIKRLLALRKSFSKKIQSPLWDGYYTDMDVHPGCQTVQTFKTKGGVEHKINISRRTIDLYIDEISKNK